MEVSIAITLMLIISLLSSTSEGQDTESPVNIFAKAERIECDQAMRAYLSPSDQIAFNLLIPEVKRRVYEADMLLTATQRARYQTNAFLDDYPHPLIPEQERWPQATVRYQFGDPPPSNTTAVEAAMKLWSRATCVTFVEDTGHVLTVTGGDGCFTTLGYLDADRDGAMVMTVAPHCHVPAIAHLLGHVLGLVHQHSRPDRDTHLQVLHANTHTANLLYYNYADYQHCPFHYDSLMQLGMYTLSDTSRAGGAVFQAAGDITDSVILGRQWSAPSRFDAALVNRQYGCTWLLDACQHWGNMDSPPAREPKNSGGNNGTNRTARDLQAILSFNTPTIHYDNNDEDMKNHHEDPAVNISRRTSPEYTQSPPNKTSTSHIDHQLTDPPSSSTQDQVEDKTDRSVPAGQVIGRMVASSNSVSPECPSPACRFLVDITHDNFELTELFSDLMKHHHKEPSELPANTTASDLWQTLRCAWKVRVPANLNCSRAAVSFTLQPNEEARELARRLWFISGCRLLRIEVTDPSAAEGQGYVHRYCGSHFVRSNTKTLVATARELHVVVTLQPSSWRGFSGVQLIQGQVVFHSVTDHECTGEVQQSCPK